MCYNCGNKRSVLHGVSLQDLFSQANAYGGSMTAAAVGRYKDILEVLQNNGGCSACMRTVEEKIRTMF